MRIKCPYCGERDQGEFTYLGDASAKRPAPDAPADAHFKYVYIRDNPAGVHRELWYHGFGCRAWVDVKRNTRTHDILDARQAARDAGDAT